MTTYEAYTTKGGWVSCKIRKKVLRSKDRTTKHIYVQLLPAMNVVKRLPDQVRKAA
jgi:hypothetical protein